MKKAIRILLPVMFIGIASCTRITEMRPDHEASVVVECILTTDSSQILNLSLTDCATPGEYEILNQARVLLRDETSGDFSGYFAHEAGTCWVLDYACIPEHRYHLLISVPGRGPISSSVCMPVQVDIHYGVQTLIDDARYFRDCYYHYFLNTLPQDTPLWVFAYDADQDGNLFVAEQIATDYADVDPFNMISKENSADSSDTPSVLLMAGERYHRKMLRFPPLSAEAISQLPPSHGFSGGVGIFGATTSQQMPWISRWLLFHPK